MNKKQRFYYVCFDAAGYDQHNAFTDNPYYFQLYIRDRARIINSETALAHVGYVDAQTPSDAIDMINRAENSNAITGMSEIRFLYLSNRDIPFAATSDEMDIIDEVISYDSMYDVIGTAGAMFESTMGLNSVLETLCVDDEIKTSMVKFLRMITWYTIMMYATNCCGDCGQLPDSFVDDLLEWFPDREYEITMAMEQTLGYYEFIDYDATYYRMIVGDDADTARLAETLDLNRRYGSAIIDDVV